MAKRVDILDIGCGGGGSLGWSKSVFGWDTYIGIDNFIGDIEKAIKSGYNVRNFINSDITTYDMSQLPRFRYSTMIHVLEHLKSEQDVENVINKAISVSDEFVFIKHPYFDGDEYLKLFDLKFTWSDWIGHPTHVDSEMLTRILDKTGLQYGIGFVYKVENSYSNELIPLSAPVDQIVYDEDKHGYKQYIEFDVPLYREMYAFINIKCKYWDELIKADVR